MIARKSHHRYLSSAAAALTQRSMSDDDHFELDEAEVWSANEPEQKTLQAHHRRRPSRNPNPMRMKSGGDVDQLDRMPRSLPVNIPDWSKILGGEYMRRAGGDDDEYDEDDDDEEEEGNDRIPPHEYLAKTRGASLSVHEGVGRTLKGRDLSRVRNAIWKQIGFED